MRGVIGRDLGPAHGHDLRPPFTASLFAFPALNDGDFEADIEITSPVLGLRPVRAGRVLAVNVPKPAIRTSSPFARASPITAKMLSTTSLAPTLFKPVRAANGAGKTTTLSMLLGLLLPTSGSVTVFGEDMVRHRHRVLPRINFSSPYVDVPRRLTVRENLTVYGYLYGLSGVAARICSIAHDLEIEPLLKRPTGNLSSGQKTRVMLAKALLNEPDLLLLDEPTASLDPDTADWMRSYLEAYRARTGATIVLASHNMAEVERLCDAVVMMREGRIVDRGAPADLVARYGRRALEEVFLDIARGRGAGQPGHSGAAGAAGATGDSVGR